MIAILALSCLNIDFTSRRPVPMPAPDSKSKPGGSTAPAVTTRTDADSPSLLKNTLTGSPGLPCLIALNTSSLMIKAIGTLSLPAICTGLTVSVSMTGSIEQAIAFASVAQISGTSLQRRTCCSPSDACKPNTAAIA